MPGPTPTPTALLKARGSKAIHARKGEPMPAVVAPDPPMHLSAAQQEVWRQLTALLFPLGLVTALDAVLLESFVTSICRMRDAERQLAEDGVVVKAANGMAMPHPAHAILTTAKKEIATCAARFGMSPADRARVTACPPPQPRPQPDQTEEPVLRIAE